MSELDFEKQIAAIMRRLVNLRAAQRGDADVKRVPVRRHFVPGFWVQKHNRIVISTRKQRVATKQRGKAA